MEREAAPKPNYLPFSKMHTDTPYTLDVSAVSAAGEIPTNFGGQTRTFDECVVQFVLEFPPN
jgi:hypothetical protein